MTTFESKIVAVQLTLDAAEVRKIAMSARAIGDEWYAERMEGRAKAALED